MQFAIENRHRFETPEQLRQATVAWLQSGRETSDEEYGSFLLTFLITPILNWIIGRMVEWVWNRYTDDESAPPAPSESVGSETTVEDAG